MFKNYIQKGVMVLFSRHSRATWWCVYTILIVCLILINLGYCDSIIKFLDSDCDAEHGVGVGGASPL